MITELSDLERLQDIAIMVEGMGLPCAMHGEYLLIGTPLVRDEILRAKGKLALALLFGKLNPNPTEEVK